MSLVNKLENILFRLFLTFAISIQILGLSSDLKGQSLQAGLPVIEEAIRRQQLISDTLSGPAFTLRPLPLAFHKNATKAPYLPALSSFVGPNSNFFRFLPVRQTVAFNTGRPYGWGNGPMVPNVGWQTYTQLGIAAKWSVFNLKLGPELVWTQNKAYKGFSFTDPWIVNARYRYWSFGDYPERFGEAPTSLLWWGQSKFTVHAGFLEAGISTENVWWGPGQFSALTFSNNARSFPHLTLRSRRPAKTFLGNFEGEILAGHLQDSGIEPAQLPGLDEEYFAPFSGDYKYLNAITVTYNPKWVPGLYLGIARTNQQYSRQQGNSFSDYFPIFEAFQKKVYGFDKDGEGRDQQVTFFGRFVFPKSMTELYFEYGRRDHAYDWREAILNPEHARAYLMGFQKLWKTINKDEFIQIRAEVLHQQESINRMIRYLGLGGGYTWHTHGQARGFTNYGEALGTGPGAGSNVQTLEISKVFGLNKRGIVFQRLANHQDFFYRAFGQNAEKKPWFDLSLGLLWDQQWERFILSGNTQFILAQNYQWQSNATTSTDFPKGENLMSVSAQISLIYLIQK